MVERKGFTKDRFGAVGAFDDGNFVVERGRAKVGDDGVVIVPRGGVD